ncbi:WD40-repeat-containing domain protein [Fimicolochytrium jonesii]|uniref:WD40-repeat-containing domain protein n=1 Tax=Fimicolochytrium jonesii TaxID=1396493 RepID=UPI0022FDFACE|nr:WD40-repeat-containing domain protein [Fimicolochytrium jonesii]KAI8817029.1 WD40-repeat-containing domain protein [Fimicolochytrium jonesii]
MSTPATAKVLAAALSGSGTNQSGKPYNNAKDAVLATKMASEAKKQAAASKKYDRAGDSSFPIRNIEDKKLKAKLTKTEKAAKAAAWKAAQAEFLLPEEAGYLEAEGLEKTWKFTQKQLKDNVDASTTQKMFSLKLDDFGPYSLDYTRNGRNMLIGGRKGHIATFDWKTGKLGCELQVKETTRDVAWLHNETMFAVAQKKYTYLYDNTGMEIHCLRSHIEVNRLEFLPYHFLLATVGNAGYLKYQDTSTGKLVAEMKTRLGKCDTMTQNPHNAIMHLGHANGTVTLWSPTVTAPLVKMLCHRGPVKSIAIDRAGHYMATAGLDGRMKLWDLRTYKELQSYYTKSPASTLSISQQGLLAVGYGPNVSIWKNAFLTKQKEPYMTHLSPSTTIQSLRFCPYEDVLGIGHTSGISSIVVPGSGEPNFDTMEANPFQTKSQRRETEVHALLDKIQPEMITLKADFVGSVDRAPAEVIAEEARIEWEANHPGQKFVPQHKKRGKSSAMRRYLRKQTNVVDEKRIEIREQLEKQQKEREAAENERKRARSSDAGGGDGEEKARSGLDRFAKRAKT